MRFLVKVSLPTERANAIMKSGKFGETMGAIMADLKPEAAYFIAENGVRTGHFIVDMQKPSDLPKVAEPFFFAFGATIEAIPAMVFDDLREAAPAIDAAAKRFG